QLAAVVAVMMVADEHEPRLAAGLEARVEPRPQQAMVELGWSNDAEAADEEVAVGDTEALPCRGARRPGLERMRLGNDGPACTGVPAVPLFRKLAPELGMHDDPLGVAQHLKVRRTILHHAARIGP